MRPLHPSGDVNVFTYSLFDTATATLLKILPEDNVRLASYKYPCPPLVLA